MPRFEAHSGGGLRIGQGIVNEQGVFGMQPIPFDQQGKDRGVRLADLFPGGNHHAVFIRRECFENLGIREGVYAERYPGMAQLPELPQVNFVTRNRGVGCPVYDRLPPATALYGNRQEARVEGDKR